MSNSIRDVPLLLGEQIKQTQDKQRKGIRIISAYPQMTEKSITPEDECCKKICPVINEKIEKTYKKVKKCEAMIDFGMKHVCYSEKKNVLDTLLLLRSEFNDKNVCKCFTKQIQHS